MYVYLFIHFYQLTTHLLHICLFIQICHFILGYYGNCALYCFLYVRLYINLMDLFFVFLDFNL